MHVSRSEWEIFVVLGYVAVAGVKTLPPDRKDFNFYDWFRDTSHLLLNSPMGQRVEQRFDLSQANGTVATETKISTTLPAPKQ